jgi:hypothetical protein
VPIDLARRLITAGVVQPDEVEAALFLSVVRGVPFARALLDRGAITERALEDELERVGGLALRQVVGAPNLMVQLPRAMCRRLAAIPTRVDASTGTVDVAASDPLDPAVAAEFSFHLGAPVRLLRAPIGAIEEAIRRLELDDREPQKPKPRPRRMTPAFPHGAPTSTLPPPPSPPPRAPEGPARPRRRTPAFPMGSMTATQPLPSADLGTRPRRKTPAFPHGAPLTPVPLDPPSSPQADEAGEAAALEEVHAFAGGAPTSLGSAPPHEGPMRRRRETPAFPHGAPPVSELAPPPAPEAVPIPLVRRASNPEIVPEEPPLNGAAGGSDEDVVLPLRHSKVPRTLAPPPARLDGRESTPGGEVELDVPALPENEGDRDTAPGLPPPVPALLPPLAGPPPPIAAPGPRMATPAPPIAAPAPSMPTFRAEAPAPSTTPRSPVARERLPASPPRQRAPGAGREPTPEPPAVSFPSEPPPPGMELSYPVLLAASAPPRIPLAPAVPLPPPISALSPPPPPLSDAPEPEGAPRPKGPSLRRPGRPALTTDFQFAPRGEAASLASAVTAVSRTEIPPPPDLAPESDDDTDTEVRRPFAITAEPVLRALEMSMNRDEVVRHALRGVRLLARRVAVFAVKRDGFHGWACNVELGDQDALRELFIPIDLPSVLATAAATSFYLGPIPSTQAHAGLLSVMERSSPDVATVAVRVHGRAAMMLLADDLTDPPTATRHLGELANAVGDALGRLLGGGR